MTREIKNEQAEPTHLVWVQGDYHELHKFVGLKEVLDFIRSEAKERGEELESFIISHQIEVFGVKTSLIIEEKVTRTIKINGEVISL